jgi:hypothetical protein
MASGSSPALLAQVAPCEGPVPREALSGSFESLGQLDISHPLS